MPERIENPMVDCEYKPDRGGPTQEDYEQQEQEQNPEDLLGWCGFCGGSLPTCMCQWKYDEDDND